MRGDGRVLRKTTTNLRPVPPGPPLRQAPTYPDGVTANPVNLAMRPTLCCFVLSKVRKFVNERELIPTILFDGD